MGCLSYFYVLTVLFTGIPAMFRDSFSVGLAGTLAPLIALVAGGAITSYHDGTVSRIWTILIALIMLAGALYWLDQSGWQLLIFGNHVSGVTEGIIGFVSGLIFGLGDRRLQLKRGRIGDSED